VGEGYTDPVGANSPQMKISIYAEQIDALADMLERL
jgi:hypothetical protein